MKMVEIALSFLKAERTGDWQLHLCVGRCYHTLHPLDIITILSLLICICKPCTSYLTYPNLYEHFQNGLNVIHRSDSFWAGLSTDLVIQQTLMHTLKTSGRLTRGSGMTERQRAIRILSFPVTAEINGGMHEFTGTKYETSDQHKEASESRITRDHSNGFKLLSFLLERHSFGAEKDLVSLTTGEVAAESTCYWC